MELTRFRMMIHRPHKTFRFGHTTCSRIYSGRHPGEDLLYLVSSWRPIAGNSNRSSWSELELIPSNRREMNSIVVDYSVDPSQLRLRPLHSCSSDQPNHAKSNDRSLLQRNENGRQCRTLYAPATFYTDCAFSAR